MTDTTIRPLKTYRHCNCERTHRTFPAMAKCCWPHHVWIHGNGPFATVSYCQSPSVRYRTITVQLHRTEDEARHSLAMIDQGACGGGCVRNHALVRLVLA